MCFIAADLFLYLLIKTIRGDAWYWIPAGGAFEVLSSFLCRVIVKVITDFTSILHFRHPYELGGAQWLFGLIVTLTCKN